MIPDEIEVAGIRGLCAGVWCAHGEGKWGIVGELGPFAITFWYYAEAKA